MNIIITGSKGYLGTKLIDVLGKRNKIYKIDRGNSKRKYNFMEKNKIFPNLIIHAAGTGKVGIKSINYQTHYKKNYSSTLELINFIKKNKIINSKIIFFSSQAVYGSFKKKKIKENQKTNPISDYGKTKLLSEKKLLKIKKNEIIILRIFSIYGIGLKKQILWDTCNKFKKKNFSFLGTGNEKRDFVNIHDFINLIKMIIRYKQKLNNQIFNVGTGKGTKISTIINLIKKNFKIKNKINFLKNSNKSENQNFIADNEKIEKKFNWKPSKNLNYQIKKYVEWYKKNE